MKLLAILLAYGFIMVTSACRAGAQSEADRFIPDGLDPRHEYKTYSVHEFIVDIVNSSDLGDNLINQKVKIFGSYDPSSARFGINRTRRAFFPSWGCQADVCDRMAELGANGNKKLADTTANDWANAMKTLSAQYLPLITIYFERPEDYQKFTQDSSQTCSSSYPCDVWAVGTVHCLVANIRDGLFRRDFKIFYVEVDEIRTHDSKNNVLLEGVWEGLGWAWHVYRAMYRLREILQQ